jgi:hypothetical protein
LAKHQHTFVDEYDGMVGFGFSRDVDEKSLIFYLQKFSEDALAKALVPRLSDNEINQLFELMSGLMRRHLVDEEYHTLFLKDDHEAGPA